MKASGGGGLFGRGGQDAGNVGAPVSSRSTQMQEGGHADKTKSLQLQR